MMKKYILVTLLLILTGALSSSWGTKAYPGLVDVRQPDGTIIKIKMVGDEFFGYATTADGSVVAQDEKGYYCYATYSISGLNISRTRVGSTSSFGGFGAFGAGKGVDASVVSYFRERNVRARMFDGTGQLVRGAAARDGFLAPKTLVLLVEFPDRKFSVNSPESAFTAMLNQEGYSVNGATGSARDFFRDNSKGSYAPQIDVFKRVTLPNDMAFYGSNMAGNDANPRQMVIDACTAAVAAGLNLAQYDTNGDGMVDNVFIFYAGHNEAEGGGINTIWPHRWSVYGMNGTTISGVRLADYACTSELKGGSISTSMAGIGTFCHEYGHVLGLNDFYDTDGETGGRGAGMGNYSIMDGGNYMNSGNTPPYYNVIEREMLGWLTPTIISSKGDITISPVQNNVGYRFDTQTSGEYYLFESRSNDGWDKFLPGSGMIVYHIDRSNNMVNGKSAKSLWESNSINNYAEHQCANLVEASGAEGPRADASAFPFPGTRNVTSLGAATSPALTDWTKNSIGLEITGITQRTNGDIAFFAAFEPTGSVNGTILDATSGAAVSGATVVLKRETVEEGYDGPTQYSTTTNTKGGYQIDNVAVGSYTYFITADEYAKVSEALEVLVGSNTVNKRITAGDLYVKMMAYQTDIKIDYRALPTAAQVQSVRWRAVGEPSFVSVNITGTDNLVYLQKLKANTAYEIELMSQANGGGNTLYNDIRVTSKSELNFMAIAQSKNRYKAGDVFDLVLLNADMATSVIWYVAGSVFEVPVGKCYYILNGNVDIKAVVTLKDSSVETLFKHVVLE